mmetsp:Transcript_31139/g.54735  ORF Transcript_31139/g.54735 Transcript_31139/m.54735 type:complete len:587 (-) Transcript_31139:252-2012(-)|eukprot:CAMPEP_0197536206 /NCGR_PEP_ID=MMETSP1318-20131121/53290_1 /TAXON_ID=552666 /ORGANISM="Partenskyella glossopodia, Strain RCC365" /LENGTH=586 /DNA_ID=CAMNT_0043094039 /DNA_START=36 /DNA_END=1796 /DNA_ORIENTATION=-
MVGSNSPPSKSIALENVLSQSYEQSGTPEETYTPGISNTLSYFWNGNGTDDGDDVGFGPSTSGLPGLNGGPGYSTFGLRQRSNPVGTTKLVDLLQMLSPFVIEFVGTMFIGLTISLSIGSLTLWGPLAYGAVLLALAFVGGQISGAHYNPAVTIAMLLCRKIRVVTAVGYLISQISGGLVAGVVSLALEDIKGDNAPYPSPGKKVHAAQAVVVELLFTIIVVKVMLDADERRLVTTGHMRHSLPEEGTFFGLGVGMATIGGGISSGAISGAVFNPAAATGLLAVHGHFSNIWIYWAGPMAGAFIAAGIWRVTTDWDMAMLDMPFNQSRFDLEPWWRIGVPYVVEFFGTFMLCFVIATTRWGAGAGVPLAPLAIGCIKVAVVYMASQSSMAHFNPAVTLAALMCGLFTRDYPGFVGYAIGILTAVLYIVSQILASFAAAFVAAFVLGKPGGYPLANNNYSWHAQMCAEAFFTFLLAYVVLMSSDTGGSRLMFHESKNRWYMYSLASGFALMAGTVAVGDISGAALNPAAGTGLPLIAGDSRDIPVYWMGPTVGALLAAGAFSVAHIKPRKNVDLPFYRHVGINYNDI